MKGTMLIVAPLYLLLCWIQPVNAKKIAIYSPKQDPNQDIALSMVEDAVDDMYSNCKRMMKKLVDDKYFKNEIRDRLFGRVWERATNCSKRNLNQREKGDEALTKDHMQAICVYTSNYQKFYETFNKAVREERKIYGSSFKFHSLHFWLTSAVQILSDNKKCHTTYRRTKTAFTGDVGKTIRFGFFASSSKKKDLKQFGSETCFEIHTCMGAYLKKYSTLKDNEEEVLIPPYEKFNITKKLQNRLVDGLSDCKVVYVLKSEGDQSNLDCYIKK